MFDGRAPRHSEVATSLAVTPRHSPFDVAQGRLIGGYSTGTNASTRLH
jgi:hypothetical protein